MSGEWTSPGKELLHKSESHLSLESEDEDPLNFSFRHLLPKSYVHRVRQETSRLLIYEYTLHGDFQWREMTRFDVHQRACEVALQAMVDYKNAHMPAENSRASCYQRVGAAHHPPNGSITPSVSRNHTPPSLSPVHTQAGFFTSSCSASLCSSDLSLASSSSAATTSSPSTTVASSAVTTAASSSTQASATPPTQTTQTSPIHALSHTTMSDATASASSVSTVASTSASTSVSIPGTESVIAPISATSAPISATSAPILATMSSLTATTTSPATTASHDATTTTSTPVTTLPASSTTSSTSVSSTHEEVSLAPLPDPPFDTPASTPKNTLVASQSSAPQSSPPSPANSPKQQVVNEERKSPALTITVSGLDAPEEIPIITIISPKSTTQSSSSTSSCTTTAQPSVLPDRPMLQPQRATLQPRRASKDDANFLHATSAASAPLISPSNSSQAPIPCLPPICLTQIIAPRSAMPVSDPFTFTTPHTDRHRDVSHFLRHHALTKAEREEVLQHTLGSRDVRKIDTSFLTSSEPAILVRKHAVLLNLIYVKAVIFHNAVLIVPPEGADDILVTLRDQLLNRDQDEGECKKGDAAFQGDHLIPFEMIAYEAIFGTAIELLLQAFREVKAAVQQASSKFTNHPASGALLNQLGAVKKSHRLFQALVEGIRDAVATTLASDEDMWQMNLTKIYKNPEWYSDKSQFVHHQQVEMFLESYLESIEGLVRQMDVVEKDIEATEMLINIQLDVNRNRILAFELTVSTFSMALGIGAVVAGIFGMNVDTGVFDPDPTHFWFFAVLIGTGTICVIFLLIAFWNLQRLGVIDPRFNWMLRRRSSHVMPMAARMSHPTF